MNNFIRGIIKSSDHPVVMGLLMVLATNGLAGVHTLLGAAFAGLMVGVFMWASNMNEKLFKTAIKQRDEAMAILERLIVAKSGKSMKELAQHYSNEGEKT